MFLLEVPILLSGIRVSVQQAQRAIATSNIIAGVDVR